MADRSSWTAGDLASPEQRAAIGLAGQGAVVRSAT